MAEDGAVGQDDDHFTIPLTNLRGKREQRLKAYNLYMERKQNNSKSAAIRLTFKQLGLGEIIICSIVRCGLTQATPNKMYGKIQQSAGSALIKWGNNQTKKSTWKGSRLIILHIGNDNDFVENRLLYFESKTDYHEEMNVEVFTEWMKTVLPLLEPN
ncbi:hypothetical protein Trydic_g12146 [Trypoxylus dichotomus]